MLPDNMLKIVLRFFSAAWHFVAILQLLVGQTWQVQLDCTYLQILSFASFKGVKPSTVFAQFWDPLVCGFNIVSTVIPDEMSFFSFLSIAFLYIILFLSPWASFFNCHFSFILCANVFFDSKIDGQMRKLEATINISLNIARAIPV